MSHSWATFVALLLLWQSVESQDWNTEMSIEGKKLVNHVIKNLIEVTSFMTCIRECDVTSDCESINMYSDKAKCELNNATHLEFPEDLVPAANQHAKYLLYSNKVISECSNKLCGDSDVCLIRDGTSHQCTNCSEPLGMEDGRITNAQITATSEWGGNHYAWQGRLNFDHSAGAWVAANYVAGEYLQIDLGQVTLVSKIAMQSRYFGPTHYVTKYSLAYSLDGVNFVDYKYRGVVKEFDGAQEPQTVFIAKMPMSAIRTRFIRIIALEWVGDLAMRTELYGCIPPF